MHGARRRRRRRRDVSRAVGNLAVSQGAIRSPQSFENVRPAFDDGGGRIRVHAPGPPGDVRHALVHGPTAGDLRPHGAGGGNLRSRPPRAKHRSFRPGPRCSWHLASHCGCLAARARRCRSAGGRSPWPIACVNPAAGRWRCILRRCSTSVGAMPSRLHNSHGPRSSSRKRKAFCSGTGGAQRLEHARPCRRSGVDGGCRIGHRRHSTGLGRGSRRGAGRITPTISACLPTRFSGQDVRASRNSRSTRRWPRRARFRKGSMKRSCAAWQAMALL